ncbi:thermonuclease family protein [Stutzerimonas urumqiensis]|uniref:thermonuclease family protein n=1 Tax=Stutzerimonas urumqiensis TaxID=638269 RepID=UPI003DA34907
MRFSCSSRKAPLVGAFFMALYFTGDVVADTSESCRPPAAAQVVQVSKVIDGDTLRLASGRSLRLIGLNAPELGGRGKSAQPYAEAARRALAEHVRRSDGRLRLVSGAEATDRYGRLLGHAYDRGGRNLEAVMLAQGMGYFVAIAPNTALAACHLAAESEARRTSRGVWQRSPVIEADRITQGGFAVVRGRVERVERNRGGVWLELHGQAVVRLVGELDGLDEPERLEGRRVEVRGWIVERKATRHARWMITVSHAAMLKSLE